MTDLELGQLEERYHSIAGKISQASQTRAISQQITLIAVSKKQSIDSIEALYRLGHRDFGENYAQEMVVKAQELEKRGCAGIRWHFIGHLQTNKIKMILPHVFSIHTVASEKRAIQLSLAKVRLGGEEAPGLPVFLEVNVDQEETKAGVSPSDVQDLAQSIAALPGLQLQGLMCIPDPEQDPRPRFKMLADLGRQLGSLSRGQLSMGMSSDFEIAIQEGATHVRVGTAIFGVRN